MMEKGKKISGTNRQDTKKTASERFFNRELSWLAFNERVLEEANNAYHPLLERLRFLSISASNLDEFYMVRVAGLHDLVKNEMGEKSQDGLTPKEQLVKINKRADRLVKDQQKCWLEIKENLKKEKIEIVHTADMEKEEKKWLAAYFMEDIFPALTPIAVDPVHPFPFLPNLAQALVLRLKKKSNIASLKAEKRALNDGKSFHAIIPIPQKLERLIKIPAKKKKITRMVFLEEVVLLYLEKFFSEVEVLESGLISIIRDSELEVSDEAEDLVAVFESAVKKRGRGDVVLLFVNKDLPEDMLKFITARFNVDDENDVVKVGGLLNLSGIGMIYDIDREDLKFPHNEIRFPERIKDYDGDCFAAIKAKDIVIHHPYESFDVVVQFLRQAALDPDVIAIKQTLYRTSNHSPIVRALVEAAEAGKSVTVVVELKARFEEEANLRWGRDLEKAGAQVIYGLVGLKTHAKVSLVVRRIKGKLESYVHFGTGNYHSITAKIYTDLSFFTCDPALCRDASLLFNYLTGYSSPKKYEKLSVAPQGLAKHLMELINDEIANAKKGQPAALWAKLNSLVDGRVINKLYEASQAGVKISLVVRGICCLRPGLPGFSDNITVKSIVGRFLEHSRIYCFGGGYDIPSPKNKLFISSADWMPRNLERRVEIMAPIENPTVHEQILGQIMRANMNDEKQSWFLQPDGSYERAKFDEKSFSAHEFFISNPSLSGRGTALHGKKNKE